MRAAWGQFKGRDEVSLKVHWVKIRAEVAASPQASLYSLYSSGCRGENTGDCGNTHTDTHTTDTHTWACLGTPALATWGCEPQERLHTQGLTWIWTRLRATVAGGCGDPPVRDLLAPNKFSVKFNYRKHLSIDWLLAPALGPANFKSVFFQGRNDRSPLLLFSWRTYLEFWVEIGMAANNVGSQHLRLDDWKMFQF